MKQNNLRKIWEGQVERTSQQDSYTGQKHFSNHEIASTWTGGFRNVGTSSNRLLSNSRT
ncbi:unnamed protein product, partial [Nesidiocoris tenuis]